MGSSVHTCDTPVFYPNHEYSCSVYEANHLGGPLQCIPKIKYSRAYLDNSVFLHTNHVVIMMKFLTNSIMGSY